MYQQTKAMTPQPKKQEIMKTYYKLHIATKNTITNEEVENMNISDFAGRLNVVVGDPKIASIIVSSDNGGNPDLDEVSELISMMDDYNGGHVFFGYPREDMSNAVTQESSSRIWNLLEDCEM